MNAIRGVYTKILLYAYDLDSPTKREAAIRFVKNGWTGPGNTAISVQVLQEMHVNLVKCGVSRMETTRIVRDFTQWPIVDNTLELFASALDAQARWKISLWESLILVAARAAGASEFIIEDLNHSQDYGGVHVIDPFL